MPCSMQSCNRWLKLRNYMERAFFIGLLLFLFASCNDQVKISGVVVEKLSNKPLDSVAVTSLEEVSTKGSDWVSDFTLSDGRFTLSCSSKQIKGKSRLPFIFQKKGYGSVTVFYPIEKKDTIYLERVSD
jgi:hypothetical protein